MDTVSFLQVSFSTSNPAFPVHELIDHNIADHHPRQEHEMAIVHDGSGDRPIADRNLFEIPVP